MNIKKYFDKGVFVIPNYQRGYKWGVPNLDDECAVSILMDSLINAFECKLPEYYVQGVTAYTNKNEVVLIDGQQRTTTFYLLLKYLKHDALPQINYDIRIDSDTFLKNSKINSNVIEYIGDKVIDEKSQDIYYFKKAIKTIDSRITTIDKENFKKYVLENVKLFFIEISKEDATKVFSMMNGQKAIMKNDELIKAALLSKSSRMIKDKNLDTTLAEEWEINSLRNKYAREWDKWLYWWNKKSVKEFYNSGNNPMGLLLEYFYYSKIDSNSIKKYNYKHFNELFFKENKDAKINYKAIRDLQKTFEDWYNDYNFYNYLGLIFKSGISKKDAILYLLKYNSINEIKRYSKWALIGATHRQITKSDELREDEITKEVKCSEIYRNLGAKEVYNHFNNQALLQLLRRNVELDCKLERKFDFSIYGEKSLEHIYPKSKAYNLKFEEDSNYSVHSMGNLVLLDRNTNSSFNDALPNEKTLKYFDLENVRWSLKLLHTVSVFTKKEWNEDEIIKNQKTFLEEFRNYYNII
jgi:hypothetical protein